MALLRDVKTIKLWKVRSGEKIMLREIRCNKGNCRTCPHKHYAYGTSGYGKGRKHRYLGTCTEKGVPRQKEY